MRKTIIILLSCLVLLSFSVPVFANGELGTIQSQGQLELKEGNNGEVSPEHVIYWTGLCSIYLSGNVNSNATLYITYPAEISRIVHNIKEDNIVVATDGVEQINSAVNGSALSYSGYNPSSTYMADAVFLVYHDGLWGSSYSYDYL